MCFLAYNVVFAFIASYCFDLPEIRRVPLKSSVEVPELTGYLRAASPHGHMYLRQVLLTSC